MKTQEIMSLLTIIDEKNVDENIITSIRFFSDGSGRIIQTDKGDIYYFNTIDEAIEKLKKLTK